MGNIRKEVEMYLASYPPALRLFRELMEVGDVFLIGGILREYKDKNRIEELRDADFIINVRDEERWDNLLKTYTSMKNRFGGYKFYCTGFPIDVWEVEKTWAYKENIVAFDKDKYLQTLPKTVFLNLDSIIYDLNENKWYDSIYQEAIVSGVLDVVLQDNPYINLNILRAMVLRNRYNMIYSEKMKEIIQEQQKNDIYYDETLWKIQHNRYQKEIISRDEIKKELELVGV